MLLNHIQIAVVAGGGYNEEQVYNCDKTGLYIKMLPNKILAVYCLHLRMV